MLSNSVHPPLHWGHIFPSQIQNTKRKARNIDSQRTQLAISSSLHKLSNGFCIQYKEEIHPTRFPKQYYLTFQLPTYRTNSSKPKLIKWNCFFIHVEVSSIEIATWQKKTENITALLGKQLMIIG